MRLLTCGSKIRKDVPLVLVSNELSSYPYICSQSSYLNVRTHHLTNNKVFHRSLHPYTRIHICASECNSQTSVLFLTVSTLFLSNCTAKPPAMSFIVQHARQAYNDKQTQVVMFSATAIALYGYDQGMMSLINTNSDYLSTMGIAEESPIVGVIVAVYYLGCAVGAVLFSKLADKFGRKKSIFFSLASASLGNLIMFVAGMKFPNAALALMLTGRVIMGLGVGGIDAVIPTYSSELSADEARGKALAQEFQSNIFGLVMAFAINLGVTIGLGKWSQWAWRTPIIVMQVYPVLLMAFVERLPESPRWFIFNDRQDDAKTALDSIYGDEAKEKFDELVEQHEKEKEESVSYLDMVNPYNAQFHPTMVTIMCQVNQALTGYGAVSVYGPQIFGVSYRLYNIRYGTD
jgi:MFS family permease